MKGGHVQARVFNTAVILVCAAVAAFCWWGYIAGLAPIPSPIVESSGLVSAVKAVESTSGRGGSRSVFIDFRLQDVDKVFTYPNTLPNGWEARDRLQLKARARVLYTQDPSGKTQLWGLAVDEHSVIEPARANTARRRQGYAALYLAIFFSGFASIMFVVARQR